MSFEVKGQMKWEGGALVQSLLLVVVVEAVMVKEERDIVVMSMDIKLDAREETGLEL